MEIFFQILIFGLISSAIYALIACGLTLTFGVFEFINFAHGEMAMFGAYVFFVLYILLGWPIWLGLLGTALVGAIIGVILERTTFKPVREKQPFIPLVLSIGITIIFQSLVIMKFGGGSQTYFTDGGSPTVFRFFDGALIITLTQVLIILAAAALLIALFVFMKHSKLGKAIRAVGDSRQVASVVGINVDKVMMLTFALATSLAAIAGVLVAFDQNLFPKMGMTLNIKAFVAIILGGVGNLGGAVVGAMIVGFSENLIVGLTNIPASYKETVVFVIMILVLIVWPYGIFGGKKEELESR